jgi:hypothetical protein
VDGGRWKADGGRRKADGGRWTVDGGKQTAGGGRRTVDGGKRTVDGGPRTADRGPRAVDGEDARMWGCEPEIRSSRHPGIPASWHPVIPASHLSSPRHHIISSVGHVCALFSEFHRGQSTYNSSGPTSRIRNSMRSSIYSSSSSPVA